MQRIISRVKSIEYNDQEEPMPAKIEEGEKVKPKALTFPTTSDIRIQVLHVFDMLGYAASLSQLQDEYTNITGSNFKIREAARGLHNVGILKIIKYKNASRGFLWVKTEWVKDGKLLDKHKPVGFDLLHKAENLIFQL